MRKLVPLFFCLLPSLAMAKDTIWLANSDRIVGDIVFKQGDRIVVETDYAGRVHIDWGKVATLETTAPISVKIKGVPGTTTSALSLSQPGTVICFQCKVKLIELRDVDSLNYSAWWSSNRRRGPR